MAGRSQPQAAKGQGVLCDADDRDHGGAALNFSPINPIKALYWSAVINGVVAVPVMVAMMHMTANPKVMGKFPVHDGLRLVGWMATAVMAAAAIAMGVTAIV